MPYQLARHKQLFSGLTLPRAASVTQPRRNDTLLQLILVVLFVDMRAADRNVHGH